MPPHPLDNPVWSALLTRHAAFARGTGLARRYPADVAPFAGLAEPTAEALRDLAEVTAPGEELGLIGPIPGAHEAWDIVDRGPLVQMVGERRVAVPPAPGPVTPLTAADAPDMVGLTDLVFRGFFRPRTHEMGAYLGIREGGRLMAMTGQRLCLDGYREVSAVCTHTEYLGRGAARHLFALVANAIHDEGLVPFLHVYPGNARALAIYEDAGFVERARPHLVSLRRRA